MRFTEVAEADGSVHRPNNGPDGDFAWIVSQNIATANAAFGFDETGTLERKQDLFEIRLRQTGSFCDVTNRGWSTLLDMQRQGQERSARIVTPSRYGHALIVWGYVDPCRVEMAQALHIVPSSVTMCGDMTNSTKPPKPVLPEYHGACVTNIVPTLVGAPSERPGWFPELGFGAPQVVLLVLDGLGWSQLQDRRDLAPNIAKMMGGPITTVCPTTTATALTSISTGLPPGEHGVVGYRIRTHGTVLNVLRWRRDDSGDARSSIPPEELQPHGPFLGSSPTVVTKADFEHSGFTRAHLRGGEWRPWLMPSNLVAEVKSSLEAGDRFVYAYYDGVDKVAHAYGLEEHYDRELEFADSLVGAIQRALPADAALLVTADHGQIEVGDRVVALPRDILNMVVSMSGEARFRWLHARAGCAARLVDEATDAFGHEAWIVTTQQVIDEHWFGPVVKSEALDRLGDVAMVPFAPVAYDDPHDSGATTLVGRHGSMTEAEVLVPLVVCLGDN